MHKVENTTAEILLTRVREQYPKLSQLLKPGKVRFLNAIESGAETEGPEAVTLDRIQGMQELFEEAMRGILYCSN